MEFYIYWYLFVVVGALVATPIALIAGLRGKIVGRLKN
jgi:hypothetical protein